MSADQLDWICLEVNRGSLSTIRTILRGNFAFPSTSREVSYSAMGCTPLDDIAHSGYRNINISGDGLVALRLSRFFHNPIFFFQIHKQLFTLHSFLHAQCDTQHKG